MMRKDNHTIRDDIFEYFHKEREERIMNDNMRAMRKLTSGGFSIQQNG